ncbi:hypothetical protein JCM10207_006349 [Rhodosporidiobolus poonsookiae]
MPTEVPTDILLAITEFALDSSLLSTTSLPALRSLGYSLLFTPDFSRILEGQPQPGFEIDPLFLEQLDLVEPLSIHDYNKLPTHISVSPCDISTAATFETILSYPGPLPPNRLDHLRLYSRATSWHVEEERLLHKALQHLRTLLDGVPDLRSLALPAYLRPSGGDSDAESPSPVAAVLDVCKQRKVRVFWLGQLKSAHERGMPLLEVREMARQRRCERDGQ